MKRLVLVAVALVLLAFQASAQFSAGIIGGLSFSEARFAQIDASTPATCNFGVTCNVDLPQGFSIQPSVVFAKKSAYMKKEWALAMSYVELPVSFQWGPDLLIFRPFVDVTPFVGHLLHNNVDTIIDGKLYVSAQGRSGRQTIEYGVGVGGGIDIWKLRLIARYNWNMGSAFTGEPSADLGRVDIKDHFKGLTLCLSIFLF